MSSSLMSCVRENSPPLEMAASDSGALSLPTVEGSTSPNNASSAEQQKRRRFHPLRNLRRMFRRRTLTSVDLSSSSSSTVDTNQLSASSPSSPLQHQEQQQLTQKQTQHDKHQQQHLEQHLAKKTQSPPTVVGSNTLSVPAHGYVGTSSSSTSLPTSPLSLSPTPTALAAGSQTCATNKAISPSHHKPLHDPTNHEYDDDNDDQHHYHHRHTHYNQEQHNIVDVTSGAMSLSTSVHHQQYATSTTTTSVSSSAIATGRNLIGTCGGIGVLPGAFTNTNRTSLLGGYYIGKDKITNTSGLMARETKLKSTGTDLMNDLESSREMTDSQRSLSEGRLVDSVCGTKEHLKILQMVAASLGLDISSLVKSCLIGLLVMGTLNEKKITVVSIFENRCDFSRDGLSQSHDSVFSESATASSLSIVLKAELADVLRKRRNRPDASDEDLGLPRSPTTPQRREITNTTNQSEVSSLSLLSMSSTTDFDDELPSSIANHSGELSSTAADRTSSSVSSRFSADSSRSEDVELFSSNWTRLSHSAAKHKMAVRPSKKKGPTRHRRTLESSVLPSTPEVNEVDLSKAVGTALEVKDFPDKAKSRSLPPGVNAKVLEQHSTETKQTVSIKRSKTEKGPSPNSTYAVRNNITKSSIFESVNTHSTPKENKDDESNFFRRFVNRNSKRGASKPSDTIKGEHDSPPENKKPNPPVEIMKTPAKIPGYSQKVEETRKEIRREIMSEGKSALSAMLNTFILSPESEKMVIQASNENVAVTPANKPKSGPAARQRYIPKDLSQMPPMEADINAKKPRTSSELIDHEEFNSTTMTVPKISKSYTEESFQSTSLIREIGAMKDQPREHFEKKPKILGLSAFQQKISRSNDSFTNSSSTDSVEIFLGTDYRKRGKSVEKSKSFRTYIDSKEEKDGGSLKSQMPSLPDLTQKNDDYVDDDMHRDLSLGFEINDNNLVKQKPSDLPLTHGIYTKNIILTTSKTIPPRIATKSPLFGTSACSKNISEIEENIDKLVKSPFVSVLRKSATVNDSMASKLGPNVTISPMPLKRIEVLSKVESKIDKILSSDDKDIVLTSPTTTPAGPPPTPTTPTTPGKVIMREKSAKPTENIRISSPQITPSAKSNSFSRTRRSSSVVETAENDKGVPEFMKIQLNRVDPTRPKINVVLSKNARESTEDLTRRFSNESVEITEVAPSTPTEDEKPIMNRSNSSASSHSEESLPKSPVKKIPDDESSILRSTDPNTPTHNTNISLHERRKLFLSEDKLKLDRKIEEMKLERKKSMSEEVRKCPTEEEPVVVILRKKSFGVIQPSVQNNNNNKDDPTPELMKVFARRSLKIKDEDLPDPPIKKFTPSMDSDKENQSSSEEKLDKFPTIQQQQNGGSKSDIDITKNRNSLADFRTNKSQSLNNNGHSTPTKAFIPPMRLSGPFRNNTQSSPVIGKATSLTESSTNNNNNNSLTNNNNNVSKPIERQSLGPVVLSTTIPPCITLVEHNPSSAVITKPATIERSATMATMNRVESEFKGIHQRRAEWEKRAKEALK